MKHQITLEGVAYRLRPLTLKDAQFVIDIRLEDKERNQYINPISNDVSLQEKWIEEYFLREGDYYFVVENTLSGQPEGLISIYDVEDGKAEWGRWVLKKGSLASIESVDLLYKIAFNQLNLDELFCRTIKDNEPVVSFHDAMPQIRRGEIKEFVSIQDQKFDVIEHYVTPDYYFDKLQPELEKKADLIFKRNIRSLFGLLKFHHIGVATDNLEKEFTTFRMLGYQREGAVFEDELQGIKGLFITHNEQPRLELLENLPDSNTLDKWIETKNKLYHFAYKVKDIENAVKVLNSKRVRLISPLKQSTYFEKRICFLVLPNRFMIELIEE